MEGPQQFLELTIVAKTILGNGFCYIGYSHECQRLFRPIYDARYLNWRSDCMNVGDRYRFKVLPSPNTIPSPNPILSPNPIPSPNPILSPNPTHLPHSNDDVLVAAETPLKIASDDWAFLAKLNELGKTTLEDIFGDGNVHWGRYVEVGTDCPSVGILKQTSVFIQDVRKNDGKIQKRVFLENTPTDLPLSNGVSPAILPATNVLLVIGLARGGWEKHPEQCFLMVVGILFL
jgi:hypothetical protein